MTNTESPGQGTDLLRRIDSAISPLDAKIDHSLYVGTVEQMRADLLYIQGLMQGMRVAIREVLDA